MWPKILCFLTSPSSYYNPSTLGGGLVYTANILSRIHERGVIIQTLEVDPSPSRQLGAKYQVDVLRIPVKVNKPLYALIFFQVIWIKSLIWYLRKRRKFDVIISATTNLSDILPAFLISRIFRRPLLVSVLVLNYSRNFSGTFRVMMAAGLRRTNAVIGAFSSLVVLRILQESDGVFCLSEPVRDMLLHAGVNPDKLHVIGAGVDVRLAESQQTPAKCFDAAFLGRLEIEKGVVDLLHCWRLVIDQHSDARLLIIGDGNCLDVIKDTAKKLGLENNLVFQGFVLSAKEKFRLLKQSRIFLFPSKSEAFGLAVVEALACGLPVVCYDLPVFNTLFENRVGVIRVRKNDIEMLATAALKLLSDKKMCTYYSDSASLLAREFDWDKPASRELELIIKTVNSRRQA